MTIGKVFAEGRKRAGLSQKDLSEKDGVHYSKEAIGKAELGTRNLPKELYPKLAGAIDDPQTYFGVWEETTGFVSIPYLDGAGIVHQSAAMVHFVRTETVEAIEHVEKTCWFKPSDQRSELEKEEVQRVIMELLDAATSMLNLVAALCKENGFSMKAVFRQWRVSLKAKKYEK